MIVSMEIHTLWYAYRPRYKSSRADLDGWINPNANPKNVKEYYEYVPVYVDNLLHIHHDP